MKAKSKALAAFVLILLAISSLAAWDAYAANSGAVTVNSSYGGAGDTWGSPESYFLLASGHKLVSTHDNYAIGSDSHFNFTSGACDLTANIAWTMGFGMKYGNVTNVCGTLFTATDVTFNLKAQAAQTMLLDIYFDGTSGSTPIQPTYVIGIPYIWTKALNYTLGTAPSTGYSFTGADFNYGTLPFSQSIYQMENCYVQGAPAWNGNLQTLSFTPTITAGKTCNIAISPGTTTPNQPYYVSEGGNVISQGSGWTWNGKVITINASASLTGVQFIVSWAPQSGAGGTGGSYIQGTCVGSCPTATATTSTSTAPSNLSAATPGPTPVVNFGLDLILLMGMIGITASFGFKAWPHSKAGAGGIIAIGTFLSVDAALVLFGAAASVDALVGLPIFEFIPGIIGPLSDWYTSLGDTGLGVVAGIFGLAGFAPLIASPAARWLNTL